MFNEYLEKYNNRGVFSFKRSQFLKEQCNAPNDAGGVYLIYKITDSKEILIYIGASGQRNSDGTLKVRKGGIKDRLINGYHPNRFGQSKRIPRHRAFPLQMEVEEIDEIKIYWWVTYDEENLDFPTDIESILKNEYLNLFNKLPNWHQ